MYRSIQIKNFRSLRDLEVSDLGRVNLVVGNNNVGKTSFLEALWLLHTPGNPMFVRNLSAFRGLPRGPHLAPDIEWETLFHNLSLRDEIEITAVRSDGIRDSLSVSIGETKQWLDSVGSELNSGAGSSLQTAGGTSVAPEKLSFRFSSDGHPEIKSEMQIGPGGETRLEFNNAIQRQAIFLSARSGSTLDELASRFTESVDANEMKSVIGALSILQPGLETLSLGFTLPERQTLVRAHVHGLPRPVPIMLLGDGVVRLLDILLAIRNVPGGGVLIDEIEHGFYYKNLEAAWRAVDTAIGDSGTQVFATTHSLECVEAAVSAFKDSKNEVFRLHRIERQDGSAKVVTYDQETAEAALSLGLEFR